MNRRSGGTSDSRRERTRRASIRLVLVCAVVLTALLGAVGVGSEGVAAQEREGYVLVQGEQCYPLEAFGNGSRSVEAFYDYRSPETDPPGWYSSYGNRTRELMAPNTSQVFLYNGSDGLSLVFLHDGVSNNTASGGTVAVNVSGLPADGNWTVQDDDYAERDDVFDLRPTSAHIEWVWNDGNRSDGAAYTGLEGDSWERITVEPAFNEASPRYPFEKWSGDPESNRIERWVARSANGTVANRTSGTNETGETNGTNDSADANAGAGSNRADDRNTTAGANGTTSAEGVGVTTYALDMDEPVTVARGPCDDEPPAAALTASPDELLPGTEVTLDASGSADNDAVAEYRWDTDGDGTVETVTNESTLTTAYNRSGTYEPRVIVADRANNTATATVSFQVNEETTTTTTTSTTSTATTTTSATTTAPAGGNGGTDEPGAGTAPSTSITEAGDDEGILGAFPADVAGIDGPSLLGLVVLTLALCVLAVVVLRR